MSGQEGVAGGGRRQWRGVCVMPAALLSSALPSRQVVSLGAGLDSLYFCLKERGLLGQAVFFEVDFPEVVAHKATLITTQEELSGLAGLRVPELQSGMCGSAHPPLARCLCKGGQPSGLKWGRGVLLLRSHLFFSHLVKTTPLHASSHAGASWEDCCFVNWDTITRTEPGTGMPGLLGPRTEQKVFV